MEVGFIRKAQITMEYVILLTFIVMMILPAGLYIYSGTAEIYNTYSYTKMDSYLDSIVNTAKIIYYNGLYSKTTLTPRLSDTMHLSRAFTVEMNLSDNYYYYLVVYLNETGTAEMLPYQSEVPLKVNTTCFNTADTSYLPECTTYTCLVCPLSEDKILSGKLTVETVLNGSQLKVELRHLE